LLNNLKLSALVSDVKGGSAFRVNTVEAGVNLMVEYMLTRLEVVYDSQEIDCRSLGD